MALYCVTPMFATTHDEMALNFLNHIIFIKIMCKKCAWYPLCSNVFCASFMTPETSNVCLKKRLDACSFLKSVPIYFKRRNHCFSEMPLVSLIHSYLRKPSSHTGIAEVCVHFFCIYKICSFMHLLREGITYHLNLLICQLVHYWLLRGRAAADTVICKYM